MLDVTKRALACDANAVLHLTSLEAVAPSLVLLEKVLAKTNLPVWINADVLAGPGGHVQPLAPQAFLSAVRGLPPHVVLSLGWTTGWTAGMDNPGNHPRQHRSPGARCGPPQDLGAGGGVGSGSPSVLHPLVHLSCPTWINPSVLCIVQPSIRVTTGHV